MGTKSKVGLVVVGALLLYLLATKKLTKFASVLMPDKSKAT